MLDRETTPQAEPDVHRAPAQDAEPAPAPAAHPGGKDALGRKENLLEPFYKDMQEVAAAIAPQFTPLGLHFRPEILLATAMQEASPRDPLTTRSFDNGLGIMQITPYRGKLDPAVAKAIGWDNSKDIETNVKNSNWRSAKPNLTAGALTMLGKARAIKAGAAKVWADMDEPHRWRAVMFAYNAGESAAIHALRAGGPRAPMISTFKNPKGKVVHHDYTAELKARADYVVTHDPFGGGAGGAAAETGSSVAQAPVAGAEAGAAGADRPVHQGPPLTASVGRGGANRPHDVSKVQRKLLAHHIHPGMVDGLVGENTLHAIEVFQRRFMSKPDGLIVPGQETERHLFGEDAIEIDGPIARVGGPDDGTRTA